MNSLSENQYNEKTLKSISCFCKEYSIGKILKKANAYKSKYMILALEKRQNEDPRALGELFFLCYDEIADIQFAEALELILSLLRNVLEEALFLTNEQINQLIDSFIVKLPEHFRSKMLRKKAS